MDPDQQAARLRKLAQAALFSAVRAGTTGSLAQALSLQSYGGSITVNRRPKQYPQKWFA